MCDEDLIFEATECVDSANSTCTLILEDQCRECPDRKKKDPALETCVDPTDLSNVNCQVYKGESCQKCYTGYRLNNDGTCTELTGISQAQKDACLLYTDFECKDCGESAFFYENSLTAHLFSDSELPQLTLHSYSLASVEGLPNLQFCYDATTVENCTNFINPFSCERCLDGYYLSKEKLHCIDNPVSPKAFCVDYEDSTFDTCTECDDGYLLQDNACVPFTPAIENCDTWDNSQDSETCLGCAGDRYVDANLCVDSTAVDGCSVYANDEDACVTCEAGKSLTANNECVTTIANCKQHILDNITPKCSLCNDFYRPSADGTACGQDGDVNCRIWQDRTTCQRCRVSYYLSAGTCVLRNYTNTNCLVRSATTRSGCEQCVLGSIFTLNKNRCLASTTVTNCYKYTNNLICEECLYGFDLVNNVCVEINDDSNCISKINGKCQKCDTGFTLNAFLNLCVAKLNDPTCKNPALKGHIEYCDDCGDLKFRSSALICIDSDLVGIDNCVVASSQGCLICNGGYHDFTDVDGVIRCKAEDQCQYGILYVREEQSCVSQGQKISGCQKHTYGFEQGQADANSIVCIGCDDGYVPVSVCSNKYAENGDPRNRLTSQVDSFFSQFQCIEQGDATLLPETGDHCARYELNEEGDVYLCKQCIFGYTGEILSSDAGTYINCTVAMENCLDQYFGGVLAQQDLHQDLFNGTIPDLYSCHKCDTGGEIPFIHKTLLGDITPYNITEDIPSDGTGGNLLVCRDPSNPAHFGLEELTGFPQECALGLAAVDQSLETGLYPTLTCLACNSGFTPQYDENGNFIIDCVQNEDCDPAQENDRLNSCTKCKEGFALIINDDFILDGCHELPDDYSQMEYVVLDGDGNIEAAICPKGTFQSDIKTCISFSSETCQNTQAYNSDNTRVGNTRMSPYHILIQEYYRASNQGCMYCGEGDILYSGKFCFDLPTDSRCKQFNDKLECQICDDEFMYEIDAQTCVDRTIEGCSRLQVVDGVDTCKDCIEGYFLINDICLLLPDFCAEVDENGDCTQCENKYSHNGTDCVFEEDNCAEYDGYECTKCNDNYFLFNDICYTFPISTSIKTFNLVFNGDASIYVRSNLKCKQGHYQTRTLFDNSCMKITTITNCKRFNFTAFAALTVDEVLCEECSSGYLANGRCNAYTPVQNCLTYNPTANLCTQCIDGYEYNQGNNSCVKIIVGLAECDIYDGLTDARTCLRCNTGFFVNQDTGECDPNTDPDNNDDASCLWYSADNTCGDCATGFQLDGEGGCEGNGPANCKKWIEFNGVKICDECEDGFEEIEQQNGTNITVTCFGLSEIPNCIELVNNSKVCKQCKVGYVEFKNSSNLSRCSQVIAAEVIDNCEYYGSIINLEDSRDDIIQCNRCQKGYVRVDLSEPVDLKITRCDPIVHLPNIFNNCYLNQALNNKQCKQCDAGYFLANGICRRCADFENCAVCNMIDSTICYVCRPGKNCWSTGENLEESQSGQNTLSLKVFIVSLMTLFF